MAKRVLYLGVLFAIILALINCGGGGGGGGGSDPASKPVLTVGKVTNFGDVIVGDSAQSLVSLKNTGKADLKISNITLSDNTNFFQGVSCGQIPLTIKPQDLCTLTISFVPPLANTYSTKVTITSNAAGSPHSFTLTGTGVVIPEAVQVDLKGVVCKTTHLLAYVQVSDQNGEAITDLLPAAFGLVIDGAAPVTPASAPYLANNSTVQADLPISAAFLMDHSGSVTSVPEWVADMEAAATGFVNGLANADEAEIIKFDGIPHVEQTYTKDKTKLKAAIAKDFVPFDGLTAMYDAMYLALEDTAARANTQRAVIVISDGIDTDGDVQLSTRTKDEVINLALDENIKIFTISIGNKTDDPTLRDFADATGGQFFKVGETSDLADIVNFELLTLLQDVYAIPFALTPGQDLTVEVTKGGVTSPSNTVAIPNCP